MYDYVVVGAGIVGLASAYHIARMDRGSSILIIDKMDYVGAGDTSKSASAFRAAFTNRVNLLLAKGSISFYEAVQSRGFNLNMIKVGYLFAVDSAMEAHVRRGVELAEREGVSVEEVPPERLEQGLGMRTRVSDLEESRIVGVGDIIKGYLFKDAGIMDADRLVDYYYRSLRDMGVEFALGMPVKEFVLRPRRPLGVEGEPFPWEDVRVDGVRLADGREVRARKKVIAALGAWSSQLLNPIGVDSYSRPKKRQLFSVRADTPELKRLLYSEGFSPHKSMPFVILPKKAYIRPNPLEGALWLGMSDELGRPFALEEQPAAEDRYYTYGILPVVSLYFPQLQDKYPSAMWAGHYDVSFDGMPVVYEPYDSDLIVAAGTSGSGIMKGDSIGRVVAGLALGMEYVELGDGSQFKVSWLGLESRPSEEELLVL